MTGKSRPLSDEERRDMLNGWMPGKSPDDVGIVDAVPFVLGAESPELERWNATIEERDARIAGLEEALDHSSDVRERTTRHVLECAIRSAKVDLPAALTPDNVDAVTLEASRAVVARMAKPRQERDEARAEVERLRGLLGEWLDDQFKGGECEPRDPQCLWCRTSAALSHTDPE